MRLQTSHPLVRPRLPASGLACGIAARLDRLPVQPNGLGPLIGEYTFGFIGDRFGRKKSMVASCAIGLTVIPEGYTTSGRCS